VPLSEWWEKAVALTIAVRTHQNSNLNEVLGLEYNRIPNILSPVTVRLAENKSDIIRFPISNELVLAPQHNFGFDALLTVVENDRPLLVYLNPKIALPTNPLVKVMSTTIWNTLDFHYSNSNVPDALKDDSFSGVHIVIYLWDYFDLGSAADFWTEVETSLVEKAKNKRVDAKNNTDIDTIEKANIDIEKTIQLELYVARFVKKYLTSNVHVVDRNKLDDWLIPTFCVIPRIVEAVENDESKEKT
jgi:hypothetical protein